MPTSSKVKVCGIKSEEEIQLINQYPVSYVGFIFAKSKRQVTQEKVIHLRGHLREDIKAVGVFVNEEASVVNAISKACNLQIIQLHGNESVDYCRGINTPVWKSISVKEGDDLSQLKAYIPFVDGILLDSFHKGETGGTGKTFNWNKTINMIDREALGCKLIIAGGLGASNVLDAIQIFKPDIVDLNSKLETNLMKDPEKVKAVFRELQLEDN